MKQIRKRLTYANVMSSIAVFLILGGATAFAASKIGTSQLKSSAVTTGKIKKEAVTTSKIKNSAVNGAKVQDGSLTGADINVGTLGTVPNATNATNASSAQPVAFAHVSATGVLDTANSKNVGKVTKVGASVYCFSGIPFAVRGGEATVDYIGSALEVAQFGVGEDSGLCPPGTQAFSFTFEGTTATAAPNYVLFYG